TAFLPLNSVKERGSHGVLRSQQMPIRLGPLSCLHAGVTGVDELASYVLIENNRAYGGVGMKRRILLAGICCGVALSTSLPLLAQIQNSTLLAGSWQFTMIPVSPTTVALVPVEALATFTKDGSTVETDSTEVVPATGSAGNTIYATPGHGIWQPAPAVGNL